MVSDLNPFRFLPWAVIIGIMDGGRVTVNGVVTGLLELKGESVILLSSAVTRVIIGVSLLRLLKHGRN